MAFPHKGIGLSKPTRALALDCWRLAVLGFPCEFWLFKSLVLAAHAEMHRDMLLRVLMRGLIWIAPLFLNGCMTHRLWTGEMAEDFYEPSAPNRLILFAAPDQRAILAEYDEVSPWRDNPRRRAYFVKENSQKIEALKKPRFVSLSSTNGLSPIPQYNSSVVVTNLAGAAAVYAITFTNENRFKILSANGQYAGSFELPTCLHNTTDY